MLRICSHLILIATCLLLGGCIWDNLHVPIEATVASDLSRSCHVWWADRPYRDGDVIPSDRLHGEWVGEGLDWWRITRGNDGGCRVIADRCDLSLLTSDAAARELAQRVGGKTDEEAEVCRIVTGFSLAAIFSAELVEWDGRLVLFPLVGVLDLPDGTIQKHRPAWFAKVDLDGDTLTIQPVRTLALAERLRGASCDLTHRSMPTDMIPDGSSGTHLLRDTQVALPILVEANHQSIRQFIVDHFNDEELFHEAIVLKRKR